MAKDKTIAAARTAQRCGTQGQITTGSTPTSVVCTLARDHAGAHYSAAKGARF